MNPDGNGLQQSTRFGNAQFPIWSRDGAWLYFSTVTDSYSFELYRMHSDGSDLQSWDFSVPSWEFAWSPTGNEIAFAYSPTGQGSNIYVTSLKPFEFDKLTDLPGVNSFPNWSPDGRWLVFGSNGQILKINIDNRQLVQLTDMKCMASYPSWLTFDKAVIR